jgi:hypothetical protein
MYSFSSLAKANYIRLQRRSLNAGKAQSKTDAIRDADNNSCDVSSHSIDHCAGYKVGYRANHVITNLVREYDTPQGGRVREVGHYYRDIQ